MPVVVKPTEYCGCQRKLSKILYDISNLCGRPKQRWKDNIRMDLREI
jgi:hypothetical protein